MVGLSEIKDQATTGQYQTDTRHSYALVLYHIQTISLLCSVITTKDFFFSHLYLFLFYPHFVFSLHLCLICSTAQQFSLLFASMLSPVPSHPPPPTLFSL